MRNTKVILAFTMTILSLIGMYASTPVYSVDTSSTANLDSLTDSTDTKTYTCPMHPEVISNEPGQCPKCGMDLELKEDDGKKDEKKDEGQNHRWHKACMGR